VEIIEEKEKKITGSLFQEAINGLFYISETDANFEFFYGEKVKSLNALTFRISQKISKQDEVEERNFEDFFSKLTIKKDWFGEKEKKIALRFVKLKEILEKNLIDIKIFRVGKINIDIYVIGIDKDNNTLGVKTHAVET
jgi:hypothetical protein